MPDAQDRLENPNELGPALRALPLMAPRESALPGLMAELAARRRRRALVAFAPVAAAALLVLALLPRGAAPPEPAKVETVAATASAGNPELARLMRANAALEQRLASLRAARLAQDGDAAQASAQMEDMVVLVDGALGANPSEERRLMLWQRRLELLQALNQVERQGSFSPDESETGRVYLASF